MDVRGPGARIATAAVILERSIDKYTANQSEGKVPRAGFAISYWGKVPRLGLRLSQAPSPAS
eukprot:3795594-Rhodomonas_salina.3